LAPGENVTLLDPHRPNSNYDAFIARVLRSICVSLGIPYECLDFASTNYSSARAALIEARKFYKKLQSYVVVHFCRPAILLLLEEAWSRGELDFDFPANRNLWAQMRWLPLTGWGWVDPTKEVEAAGRAIEIGISTRADEAAALGRDYEEIVWQQQREQEMRAAAGLRAEPIAVTDSEDDGA
jgi:lambda family phage portal protein